MTPSNIERSKYLYLLLAAGIVTHILSDIKAGDGEDDGVLGGLQQVDKDAQQLVVLLVQALGILAPELGRLVDRRPLQATAAHLSGVLIEGAQVLHRVLQLLAGKKNTLNF